MDRRCEGWLRGEEAEGLTAEFEGVALIRTHIQMAEILLVPCTGCRRIPQPLGILPAVSLPSRTKTRRPGALSSPSTHAGSCRRHLLEDGAASADQADVGQRKAFLPITSIRSSTWICGPNERRQDSSRQRQCIDQRECDLRRSIATILPVMVGAPLDHDVAWAHLHLALIRHAPDLSRHHDHEINRPGPVQHLLARRAARPRHQLLVCMRDDLQPDRRRDRKPDRLDPAQHEYRMQDARRDIGATSADRIMAADFSPPITCASNSDFVDCLM